MAESWQDRRHGTTTMITVAPPVQRAASPTSRRCPVTLDELVSTAKACEAAGAAMIHIHIRDADAQPSLDPNG